MVDSTDHVTGKTGLTPTVTLRKVGGAFASPAGAVTEIASGWYEVAGNATDNNTLGPLLLHATGTAADPTDVVYEVTIDNLVKAALRGATAGRDVVVDTNGLVDANTVKLGPTGTGTAQTARDIGASVLLSAGSGTGQLDFTSGVVKANATQWLGGTIPAVNVTGVPLVDSKYLLGTIYTTPATAGIQDINVKNINNVAAATPGATGGLFIAGTNAATTVTTSFTTTFTGNLTGSVASVTGAVGSVTARVTANADQWAGGTIPAVNVTGVPLVDLKYTLGTISPATAGSVRADAVTGAVGSVTGNVGGNVVGSVGSVTGNVGGNIVGSLGSVAAGGITAASFGAGAVDAVALSTDAGQEIADRLLARNIAGGSDGTRTVTSAMRKIRNRVNIAAGTMTVYQEDDATADHTAAVTTTAGNPISQVDPA